MAKNANNKKVNNLIQYGSNVGRSLAYTSVEAIKEMNPVLESFAKTNSDLTKELFTAVKDYKGTIKKTKIELSGNKFVKAFNTARRNFVEDLKTGNWYNKERENSVEDDLLNFDDEDDWNLDWSDEEESDSDNFEVYADKSINEMNSVAKASTNAIIKATSNSIDYLAKTNYHGTKSILDQNNKNFAQVNLNISTLNSNLLNLVALGEPITTHINNSKTFYTEITNGMNTQIELLKELLNVTKSNSVDTKKEVENVHRDYDYITDSNGALDIEKYIDTVKHNILNKFDFLQTINDMDIGNDSTSLLDAIVSTPISELLKSGAKSIIPRSIKKSSSKLSKTFGDTIASLLLNLNTKANSGDSPVFEFLNDIFGIRLNSTTELRTDKYEKGKVNFDGITRKSIIEVIPTYLAKILASVSGEEETRYDYNKGRFITVGKLKKSKELYDSSFYRNATGDFKSNAYKMIDDLKLSKYRREELDNDIETFLKYLYLNGESFNYKDKENFDYSKYGISPDSMEIIRAVYKANEKMGRGDINTSLNRKIASNKAAEYRARKLSSKNSDDVYINLLNDSINYDNKDENSSEYYNRIKSEVLSDENGNSLFFYLQDYYKQLGFITNFIKSSNGNLFGTISNVANNTSNIDFDSMERTIPINKRSYKHKKIINETKKRERDYNYLRKRQDKNGVLISLVDDNGEEYDPDRIENDLEINSDVISDKFAFRQELKDVGQEIEDDETGFIGALRRAGSIGEKYKIITDSIETLTKKPALFLSSVLDKTNEHIYNILYGENKNGEDNKGFIDILKDRLNETFDSVLDKSESLWEKAKNGIDSFMKDSLNLDFGLSDIKKYIKDTIWGKEDQYGDRTGGVLGEFARNTVDVLKEMANDHIATPFKKWVDKANEIKNDENNNPDSNDNIGNMYKGGKVTKTGVIAVTGGEYIIPAPGDKKEQLRKENIEKEKFLNSIKDKKNQYNFLGNFVTGGRPDIDNNGNINDVEGAGRVEESDISEDTAVAEFIKVKAKELTEAISKQVSSLFGDEKEKEKIKRNVQTVLEESKIYSPNVAAGALVGGGLSLITGMVGGPLLGAAVGSAVTLTKKSDRLQNMLFGELDDNGNRTGGLLSKEQSEFIEDKAPDIVKFGLGGSFLGSMVAGHFGALPGLAIGATLGYAKNTEGFGNAFFGEGAIGEGLKDRLKKSLPKMGAGAFLGMMFSPLPLGIVGNTMLGAAIGFASNSDKFQDFMFGKKDEHGKRNGGIAGALKKHFLNPIINFGKNYISETQTFFKEKVFEPIEELMDPIRARIRNKKNKLAEKLKKKVGKKIKHFAGSVAGTVLRRGKNAFGRFGTTAAEKLGVELPTRIAGGLVKLPFRIIGGAASIANNTMRNTDTARGINDYESFEEQTERLNNMITNSGDHGINQYKNIKKMNVLNRLSDLYNNDPEALDRMASLYRYSQDLSVDVNGHAANVLKQSKKTLNAGFDQLHTKARDVKAIKKAIINGDEESFRNALIDANIDINDGSQFSGELKDIFESIKKERSNVESYDKSQNDLKSSLKDILGMDLDKDQSRFLMNQLYSYSHGNSKKTNDKYKDKKNKKEWSKFWQELDPDLLEELNSDNLSDDSQERLRDLISEKARISGLDIKTDSYTNSIFQRLNSSDGWNGSQFNGLNDSLNNGISELVEGDREKKDLINTLIDQSTEQIELLKRIARSATGNDYNNLNEIDDLSDNDTLERLYRMNHNIARRYANSHNLNFDEDVIRNAIDNENIPNHALGGQTVPGLAVVSKGEEIIENNDLDNKGTLISNLKKKIQDRFEKSAFTMTDRGGIIRLRKDKNGEVVTDLRDRDTRKAIYEAGEESRLLKEISNKLDVLALGGTAGGGVGGSSSDSEEKDDRSFTDKVKDFALKAWNGLKTLLGGLGLMTILGPTGALDETMNDNTETFSYTYDEADNRYDTEKGPFSTSLWKDLGTTISFNAAFGTHLPSALKLGAKAADSLLSHTPIVKTVYSFVKSGIMKILQHCGTTIEKFFPGFAKLLGHSADNIAEEAAIKAAKKTAAEIANIIGKAIIVAIFLSGMWNGYNAAESYWEISNYKYISNGLRCATGLIVGLTDCIPVIDLIPKDWILNLFKNYAIMMIEKNGEENVSDGIKELAYIDEEQKKTQEETNEYNTKYNTNLTTTEYIKKVKRLGLKWTERFGIKYKSFTRRISNNGKVSCGSNVTEKEKLEALIAAYIASGQKMYDIFYQRDKNAKTDENGDLYTEDSYGNKIPLSDGVTVKIPTYKNGKIIYNEEYIEDWKELPEIADEIFAKVEKLDNGTMTISQAIGVKEGDEATKAIYGSKKAKITSVDSNTNNRLTRDEVSGSSERSTLSSATTDGYTNSIRRTQEERDLKYNAPRGTTYSFNKEYFDKKEENKEKLENEVFGTEKNNSKLTAKDDLFDKNNNTNKIDSLTGSGSNLDNIQKKNGTFVSQLDSKFANKKFTKNTTIGQNGCGPAVASMILNSVKNKSVGLDKAAKFALKGNYATDQGTESSYFRDFLGGFGIKTNYIENTNKSKLQEIKNKIANGEQVILLGNDKNNKSKNNSPFGSNDHYVLANGVDKNGNVIINDPESDRPKKYNSKILNNVKLGIETNSMDRASGSGLYRGGTTDSSGKATDTTTAEQVYGFLTSKGYSPAAAAGILGNMEQESSVDPARLQNNGGPAAGIAQWENHNTQSGRWRKLYDYASSKNYDWKSLTPQLEFLDLEMNGDPTWGDGCVPGILNDKFGGIQGFKNADDPRWAAEAFMTSFERCKPENGNLSGRMNWAEQYYNMYSGSTYTGNYQPEAATGAVPLDSNGTSSNDTSATSSSDTTNIIGSAIEKAIDATFGSVFGSAFAAIKGLLGFGSSESDTTVTSSTGSTNGITQSGVDASQLTGVGAQDIVTYAKSKIGKLHYSQTDRDIENGTGDCSSFAQWAVQKATGIDPGGNTEAIYTNPNGADISVGTLDESQLQPGDLLLYNRNRSGHTDGVGHVEIYEGDGKRIGNKGPNVGDIGATETDINIDVGNFLKAKRFATMDTNITQYDSNGFALNNLVTSSLSYDDKGNKIDQSESTAENNIDGYDNRGFATNTGSGSGIKRSTLYMGGGSENADDSNTTSINTSSQQQKPVTTKTDSSQFAYSNSERTLEDIIKKKSTNNLASVVKALSATIDQLSAISSNTEYNIKIYELLLKYLVQIASNTGGESNVGNISTPNANNNLTQQTSAQTLKELSNYLNLIATK